MLQLTHYLLPHTFSPHKPEDGVTTTGGELVLNSFLSLKLTFWWVKLRSVWIRSRQGARHTLQCRHFLHRARKEVLTSILALVQASWGAHCQCKMHCFLRLLLTRSVNEQESHRLFKGESVQNLGNALSLKKKTEAQMEELRSPADYCFSECASKSNNGFYSHLSANSTVSSRSNLSKIHTIYNVTLI